MPEFTGVHHIALTVSDLAVSVPFYGKVFGVAPIAELTGDSFARRVFRPIPSTSVGLTQHDPALAGPFTPLRPGLDHVGFGCADRASIDEWAAHLDNIGIEHSGIVDDGTGTSLSFKDPDNIALEFYVSALASGV